jgi:addiction module RelE/StbE family toxin
VKLVWARYALSDRDGIFTYIRAENPKAAVLIDQQVASAARRLLEFPESGRIERIEGTRELVVPRTPYILAYIILPDRIRILRVLHGAQMWPDELSTD